LKKIVTKIYNIIQAEAELRALRNRSMMIVLRVSIRWKRRSKKFGKDLDTVNTRRIMHNLTFGLGIGGQDYI
jgi:hypothetical protein